MKAEVHTQPELARDLSKTEEIVLAVIDGTTHLWLSDGSKRTDASIATYLGNLTRDTVTVIRYRKGGTARIVP